MLRRCWCPWTARFFGGHLQVCQAAGRAVRRAGGYPCSMRALRTTGHTAMHRLYIEHSADVIRESRRRASQGARSHWCAASWRGCSRRGHPALCRMKQCRLNSHGHPRPLRPSAAGNGQRGIQVLRSTKVPVLLVRAGIEAAIIEDKLPGGAYWCAGRSLTAEAIIPYVEKLATQWARNIVKIILAARVRAAGSLRRLSLGHAVKLGRARRARTSQVPARLRYVSGRHEKHLKEAGFKVRSELPLGGAAKEIIELSERIRANLIAMVIHGRSGIADGLWQHHEEVMLGIRYAYTSGQG